MRLYKIHGTDIIEAMESPDLENMEGNKHIAIKKFPKKFGGLSLKVVYKKTNGKVLIITAYPLKRKHWE